MHECEEANRFPAPESTRDLASHRACDIGVGTFAVQIAKSFGAEVAAVCSTRNVDTARSIGADHVIDYTREDFTHSGQRYDLIMCAMSRSISGVPQILPKLPSGLWRV